MTDDLVMRLRGEYRIPITDGLGATGGGDEPDNPHEFVRHFEVPPIHREAADAIEQLRRERDERGAFVEENRRLCEALAALIGACDAARHIPKPGVCGMTIEAQARHEWIMRLDSSVVEYARAALEKKETQG